MSFLSKVGKVLLGAGMAAAAPLTGGASLTALPTLLAAGAGGLGALTSGGVGGKGAALGAAGEAIGKATSAAGQNRLNQEMLGLQAAPINIQGQSEFERQLLARATLQDQQREQARKNAYRASVATNPVSSPYNPRPQTLSPQFLADMGNVSSVASSRLAAPDRYGAQNLPDVTPYTPLDIKNLEKSTGTEKGKLEKIGDWAGPISSVVGRILMARGGGGARTNPGNFGSEEWMNH